MARDSDRGNAHLESARKEVTFDIKDLEKTIFLNKRDPTAHARRRSKFGEDVSVRREKENIFDDIPPSRFEECRYEITTESLNSVIQNGVLDLATKYGNDAKRPAFPFRPFTENGKKSMVKFCQTYGPGFV